MDWGSAISGAGSGALTGLAAGGPIGAVAGGVLGFLPSLFGKGKKFNQGDPSGYENRSVLRPDQETTYRQLQAATQGRGAGGAFGEASDYYRDLLSNNSADFDAFAAPEMRRFNEQTIPDLSEQFAGMGAGNLSSSGFRNAAVNAGADLSERLGAIRANLRQRGAEGLQNIGQFGLGNFGENIYHTAKPGFLDTAAEGFGKAIPGLAEQASKAIGGWISGKGKSDPYGQDTFNQTANEYQKNRRFGTEEF